MLVGLDPSADRHAGVLKGIGGILGQAGQRLWVVVGLSLEDGELHVLLDEVEEVGYGFYELDELTYA
jgi:hypothetical protein